MTGRRAQVLLCVYMTFYVRWLIISGQTQVYIPEVAGDKYLADTEGAHNISSCHLLYSQLVICSSSSSSSSSVTIFPSSIHYFIMVGVDITFHGYYYYYLNRWGVLRYFILCRMLRYMVLMSGLSADVKVASMWMLAVLGNVNHGSTVNHLWGTAHYI